MQKFTDFSLSEFENFLVKNDEKKFRATQVFKGFYQQNKNFDSITNISNSLKEFLKSHFSEERIEVLQSKKASDDSIKILQKLHDGYEVESVLMKNNTDFTVCISTQVGCAMGCKFCMTATMGLKRNLGAGEIVDQVLNAREFLPEGKRISNIVYMGMGEPFHNYENTMKSLKIFLDKSSFDFSNRKITISTSGIIPRIKDFLGGDVKANLAISLNGVNQSNRLDLMPISKKYPLTELLEVCREYSPEIKSRITFEYILMKGVTDQIEFAKKLVKLLHGIKSKVNLIPYNENSGLGFKKPSFDRVKQFQQYLLDHGVLATLRISKGQDIAAACGQLAVDSQNKVKRVV